MPHVVLLVCLCSTFTEVHGHGGERWPIEVFYAAKCNNNRCKCNKLLNAKCNSFPNAKCNDNSRNAGVPFRNLGVPFRNLGVPFRNLGVPFRNLGVPFRNLGVPFRNLGVPFRILCVLRRKM